MLKIVTQPPQFACKILMCRTEKTYTLNFAAQSQPTGSAFNFYAHAKRRKLLFRGVRWHTKNAYVPYQAFIPHFSMLALTSLFICSFALMQKNQKIKAMMRYSPIVY
jgi:hypothetical protein